MSSVDERVKKSREDRLLREKARIEKLRELNIRKYSHSMPETQMKPPPVATNTVKKMSNNEALDSIKKLLHATFKKAKNDLNCDENVPQDTSNAENLSKIPKSDPDVIKNIRQINKKVVSEVQETLSAKKINRRASRLPIIEPKTRKSLALNYEKPNFIAQNRSLSSKTEKPTLSFLKSNDPPTSPKSVMPNTNKNKLLASNTNIPSRNGDVLKKNMSNSLSTSKYSSDKNCLPSKTQVLKNLNRKSLMPTMNKTVEAKRVSLAPKMLRSQDTSVPNPKTLDTRKSMLPSARNSINPNIKKESVFDRLYKPKFQHKDSNIPITKDLTSRKPIKKIDIVPKLKTAEPSTKIEPVRRSISAVHFKRISRSELPKCMQRWSSIGENLDKAHLKERNEDEGLKGDVVISAVKSDRKKVTFKTPISFNYNMPSAEELQSRLKNWLQKRGKSIDSYHHLQCFGVHLVQSKVSPLTFEAKDQFDEENKENIALESDSDNQSYEEIMNVDKVTDVKSDSNKWRRASYKSDSTDLNETKNMSLNSEEVVHHVDELLQGALNDLTELLKEGFDWEQCARWLRAVRDRFPHAPDTAAYWECRAALEERRGDLPASMECWGEAIAKGTKHTIVEENLDQLLDKFMQLKISPDQTSKKSVDPKLIDVKNVFKSTIIRFAVQQAKLRQSSQQEVPKYMVTPVRRSGRLSAHWSGKRTPLQLCTSVRQASQLGGQMVFVPNNTLCQTP